ncbi:hypothetical protein LTR86_003520 [Recurvomyces mirabilis]|nr:hypothetical protein LTR86_003520 [Recurvomyces mirabilis]
MWHSDQEEELQSAGIGGDLSGLAALYRQVVLHSDAETRILVIHEPRRFHTSSTIECSLERISPNKSKDGYYALSYRQGTAVPEKKIRVSGVELLVRSELHAALVRLRSEKIYRIWIDALCIQQFDKREKAQQIRMMGAIYQMAIGVYAWLGPANDSSAAGMKYLSDPSTRSAPRSKRERFRIRRVKHHQEDSLGPTQQAVHNILDRPYWERVWIIQEISMARTVTFWCGEESVDFDSFMKALGDPNDLSDRRLIPQDKEGTIDGIRKFRESVASARRMTLLGTLLESHHSQATDKRDKIYALRSLAHDGEALIPFPSYDDDAAVVFRDTTRALIEHGYVDVLLLNRHTPADPQQNTRFITNSWTPDWSDTESIYPSWIWNLVRSNADGSLARGRVASNDRVKDDSDDLSMRGVRLDKIRAITASVKDNRKAAKYSFDSRKMKSKQRASKVLSQDHFWQSLWRALTFHAEVQSHECGLPNCTAKLHWPAYPIASATLLQGCLSDSFHEDSVSLPGWLRTNEKLLVDGKSLGEQCLDILQEPKPVCCTDFAAVHRQLEDGLRRLERNCMRIALTESGQLRVVYQEAQVGDRIYALRLPSAQISQKGRNQARSTPSSGQSSPAMNIESQAQSHGPHERFRDALSTKRSSFLSIPSRATSRSSRSRSRSAIRIKFRSLLPSAWSRSSPRTSMETMSRSSDDLRIAVTPDVSLPVVLRKVATEHPHLRPKHHFLYVGEVYLADYNKSGAWLKDTGWTPDDFEEDKWDLLTLK